MTVLLSPRYLLIVCVVFLGACSSVVRNPLPAEGYEHATVLGRGDLRYWGDTRPPLDQVLMNEGSRGHLEQRYSGIMHTEHHYLALSGGGSNGAYGAGLLKGWTEAGTRPEFAMVTGISTGALIAPFAFLGPTYDGALEEVYTTLDTSRILEQRSMFAVLGGDALVDTTPLSETIEKYLPDNVISEIAAEYRRGRALFIGTTNLDAARPVIWNIGRIAASGDPDAPDLIRKILRASASIPGVFPPVYIPVQGIDGKVYDEMHVDGGASEQIFLYPAQANWKHIMQVLDVQGKPTAYLIRNAKVAAEYAPVDPKLTPIVGKTINSLIRTQGVGDMYRIYALGLRDGIEIKLTVIPTHAITIKSSEAFDPNYMRELFNYGYQQALSGKVWLDVDAEMRKLN